MPKRSLNHKLCKMSFTQVEARILSEAMWVNSNVAWHRDRHNLCQGKSI